MTTGTRVQYAEHIQKSPAYVTKLGHQGRLVERVIDGKKLVDFEMSDRLIRNTTDLGRARNGTNAKPGSSPSLPVAPIADSGRVDAIYRQAQAQERAYLAKLAELNYKRAIGELVVAADIRAVLARKFATARDTLMQMPARLTPQIAADPSPANIERLMVEEITNALNHISSLD